MIGTLAFHLGTFGRILIAKVVRPEALLLDHAFKCLLVTGLFLLPSGKLHAAMRTAHTIVAIALLFDQFAATLANRQEVKRRF